MTDPQATGPTPSPENPPAPPAAPAPPTSATTPPTAPATWAPSPAPARAEATGGPVRASVAVVGLLALLAVIGAIVWDGGSTDGPGTGAVGSANQVGAPASPGASGSSSGSGGLSPKAPAAPIDPTDLGPSGASMAPTEPGTALQWRLPGNWQDQIATYRASFPAAGYELYRKVGGETTNDAGQAVAVFYEVVPIGAEYYDKVGYLEFRPDPDDPEGSTYIMWRTSL